MDEYGHFKQFKRTHKRIRPQSERLILNEVNLYCLCTGVRFVLFRFCASTHKRAACDKPLM